jgi:hypothetical protein
MPHASDSAAQRDAEAVIIKAISDQLGADLVPRRVDLPGGTWVEVDAADPGHSVFAEAFAHVGPMKGGQQRKVALDVLKLITIQRSHPGARLVLAFCDESAMSSLTRWLGEAITIWDIERRVAPLDPQLRERLLEAQARQYR